MAPNQPALRTFLATDQAEPEQIVETATVDACHDDFAAAYQFGDRQRLVDCAIPELGAGPAIPAEPGADLHVEMLREEDLQPFASAALLLR